MKEVIKTFIGALQSDVKETSDSVFLKVEILPESLKSSYSRNTSWRQMKENPLAIAFPL